MPPAVRTAADFPARRTETEGAPQVENPPAVHRVMVALAWIPRLVLVHLTWGGLVLLGGVITGLAPATVTMITVLREPQAVLAAEGFTDRIRVVLALYRDEWGPANRAAGPFVLIGLAAALNVALGVAGALPQWFFPVGFAASAVIAALATAATFHAIALHALRPALPAPVLWRGALAGPFLLPIATASWAITLCATLIISVIIQPIGWLLSGGILIVVTTHVLVRTWHSRLELARRPSRP